MSVENKNVALLSLLAVVSAAVGFLLFFDRADDVAEPNVVAQAGGSADAASALAARPATTSTTLSGAGLARRTTAAPPSTALITPAPTTTISPTTAPPATVAPNTAPPATAPSSTVGTAAGLAVQSPTLALPVADPAAPVADPIGTYRQGKLILSGSVPDEVDAAGYLRKASAVLGEANVSLQMQVDSRASVRTLRIVVEEQFQFPTGSVEYDPGYEGLLNLGVFALEALPESTLVITGYTDSVGDEVVNAALSLQRAQVVVDWMVGRGDPA